MRGFANLRGLIWRGQRRASFGQRACINLQQRVVCEFGITCRALGARALKNAVTQLQSCQFALRQTQPVCRSFLVDVPGLGAHMAQGAARILHREASRGNPFIGAVGSAGGQHANAGQGYTQAIRYQLRQRRADALAQIHLAAAHADKAISMNAQPMPQARVGLEAGRQGGLWRHAGASCITWAARSTARTMRLWLPHRHRCLSNARRTSVSPGLGFLRSNSVAVIKMPERQ